MDTDGGSGSTVVELVDGWEYAVGSDAPGIPRGPWHPVGSATTVAAVKALLQPSGVAFPGANDDADHWFGIDVVLPIDPSPGPAATFVHLDGVATVSEFFWNGHLIGSSDSMFSAHRIDVSRFARPGTNRMTVRCLSLTRWMNGRKLPRTRWKTRLVEDQKLRGVRTTLLGRASGWSPPSTAVGLWSSARVVELRDVLVESNMMRAALGTDGAVVAGEVGLLAADGAVPVAASARLSFQGDVCASAALAVNRRGEASAGSRSWERWVIAGTVALADPQRWWPHSHGPQPLYRLSVVVELADGRSVELDLGNVGFRLIEVDRGPDGDGFGLVVNGLAVFARGGAWFPLDSATFAVDPVALRERLGLLRRGGHNMIRISGTAGYESPEFYAICDELGLLVWQDLPFANFDYPGDASFLGATAREVAAFLERTPLAPSLCVIAGGSEVQQQAAMMGVAEAQWAEDALVAGCRKAVHADGRDVVFVDSSPTGGHLPFSIDVGVSHYFGVGAYRRPLTDARHAGVRFAAECLAFSNVPDPRTVRSVIGDGVPTPTDPVWKTRVPRDRGTGWDFEDVRDFYACELFDLDPVDLRYADPERYLAVARAVSCRVIEQTLAEWRRPGSPCRGALLWTLNDLWPGAGWGIVDAFGRPKAAYWGARRSLAPVAVVFVDEGLNGLDLHLFNDTADDVDGRLEVRAVRGAVTVFEGVAPATVEAHGARRWRVDELFGRFTDPTYAYRFGPRSIDAVSATWIGPRDETLGRSVFVPSGERLTVDSSLVLDVEAEWTAPDAFELRLSSNRPAQFVTVDLGATTAETTDDHLMLVPGDRPYVVGYRVTSGPMPKRVQVSALNGPNPSSVLLPGAGAT